ncbi:MAG: Hsp20/alpha crystallin family protein [Flavobacteriia bacterium]|nr:Hsp20/alpha crystallin family protein [Flavobacteriia bacterium]
MTKLHIKPNREEFLTSFDSLFDSMVEKAIPSFSQEFGVGFFGNNSYPKVDVIDQDDKIVIEAEIPGLTKDDVSVDLEDKTLCISGGKQSSPKDRNKKYIKKELKRSNFKRSFTLGERFNLKKVKAQFENGLLLIEVPKKEPDLPKKIKIL